MAKNSTRAPARALRQQSLRRSRPPKALQTWRSLKDKQSAQWTVKIDTEQLASHLSQLSAQFIENAKRHLSDDPSNPSKRQTVLMHLALTEKMFREELGFPPLATEPLVHLILALSDVDRGVIDTMFEPIPGMKNNADLTSNWKARALIAAAYEARRAIGTPPKWAASAVAMKLPEIATRLPTKGGERDPATQVKKFAERFRSGKYGPEGKAAIHMGTYQLCMARLRDAEKIEDLLERSTAIEGLYESFITLAFRSLMRNAVPTRK